MPRPQNTNDDWELVSPSPTSPNDFSFSTTDSGKEDDIIGIAADLLIPGKGDPLKDQAILCSKSTGKIIYVGYPSRIPPMYYNVHLKPVPVVMPGMWECHAHFMGAPPDKPINAESLAMTNAAEAGARAARSIKDTLYAGFTSAVELGGYATELKKVVEEGSILGPNLYGAGGCISMTAGHGDVFEYV